MSDYTSRQTRHAFIAKKFSPYLIGKVLNIGGGGKKHLLEYLSPEEYLELDIEGEPDLKIDLDGVYPLPIDNNQFDAVICTDVLEHLEHFHRVFFELIRISRKYIIISLPNALTIVPNYLRESQYQPNNGSLVGEYFGTYSKFYGLPKNYPSDRHRWFFSFTEAQDFFHYHQSQLGYRILEEFPIGLEGSSVKGKMLRKIVSPLISERTYKNLFAGVYWNVLEKGIKDEQLR